MANYNLNPIPIDESKDIINWSNDLVNSLIGAFNNNVTVDSNVNGTFIKFENGLMICHTVKVLSSAGVQTGGWNFPANFDLTKPVTVLHSRATGTTHGGSDELYFNQDNYNTTSPYLLKQNSISYWANRNGYTHVFINIVAIGRYK